MKTVTKDKPLDLTEIEKLPLLERQRIFKEFLVNSKNKDVLRLINDEIKKTEFEEEELEKLEDIPKKKEEETKGQNLDNLVERFSEKELPKENEKNVSGRLYGLKEEHNQDVYKIDNTYTPQKADSFKSMDSGTLNSEKVKSGLNEENLSNSFGLKKMTDMYNKHKKGEHDHGH